MLPDIIAVISKWGRFSVLSKAYVQQPIIANVPVVAMAVGTVPVSLRWNWPILISNWFWGSSVDDSVASIEISPNKFTNVTTNTCLKKVLLLLWRTYVALRKNICDGISGGDKCSWFCRMNLMFDVLYGARMLQVSLCIKLTYAARI